MDDRAAALLAEAAVSDATVEYEALRGAVFARETSAGFLRELLAATPRAFTRALNDPAVHDRAAELGARMPGWAP
jgi:hypothetical protein